MTTQATVTPLRSIRHGHTWWDQEPDPIQAVLTLAALDEGQRSIIASLFLPNHVDVLDDLATCLANIDRCSWDNTVLDDNIDRGGWTACDRDIACEQLAESLRAEAVTEAALLAEMVRIGRAS